MQVIYFTKFLKGFSPEEIASTATSLGVDGLDLAIRAGHAVNPSNVTTTLPAAMETFRQHGLTVPLVTLEASALDPADLQLQGVFEACGKAGVSCLKLGYWTWQPGEDYWARVESIRRSLAGFAALGEKHGVCSLVHTHSDAYYGLHASAAMELVRDLNPAYLGIYLDPGHLSVDGEPLPLAIAICREYLKMVSVKNVRYAPAPPGRGERWKRDWCYLDEGLVDWKEAINNLLQAGYTGPLSVHGEYSATEETDAVLRMVERDVKYLKEIPGVRGRTQHRP